MSNEGPHVVVPSSALQCERNWFWCHYMESDLAAQFFFAFGLITNILCVVLFVSLAMLYWCNVKGRCRCRRSSDEDVEKQKKEKSDQRLQAMVGTLKSAPKTLTGHIVGLMNEVNLLKKGEGKNGLLLGGYQKLDDDSQEPPRIVVDGLHLLSPPDAAQ